MGHRSDRQFFIDENGHLHHSLAIDGTVHDRDLGRLRNITVQHFEQKTRPADYHSQRRTNKPAPKKPFPSRRIIKRITTIPVELEGENNPVHTDASVRRPRILSFQQFQILYDAIACSSGWWPLADSRWDWRTYFSRLEKYVIYLDDLPIGFAALDRNREGPNVTRIVFVGIIPSMQGYKFGSYIFNFINHLAWEGGTEKVVLNTAPEFDTMKGIGKPEKAASKMYIEAGFRLIQTEIVDAQKQAETGTRLEQLNLPGYYKNNPSFQKDVLLQRLCEEFHCRKPYLPARAKGR